MTQTIKFYNWCKFGWSNKYKPRISNEPCDAQNRNRRAPLKHWNFIEGSVGLDNMTVMQIQHPEHRRQLDLFSC